MALKIRKLIQGLANIKNEKTAKNKYLKTKPKMAEMKRNVEDATKTAVANKRWLEDAEIGFEGGGLMPPFEKNSFKPLTDKISAELQQVAEGSQTLSDASEAISLFDSQMEVGIVQTTQGIRYLTTRARGIQIGNWQPMTPQLAASLSNVKGKIE